MNIGSAFKFANASKHLTKLKVLTKKHAPEILIVGGTVLVVTSGVMACKQTLKAHDILVEANNNLGDIEEAIKVANPDDYTKKDIRNDRMKVYGRTFIELAKCYGPSVIGAIIGFGMIFGSHKIMSGRNAALALTYSKLAEEYKKYREKMINELGEDREFQIRSGAVKGDVSYTDEEGNEVEVKDANVIHDNGSSHSMYARIFDETNPNWSKNPSANLQFLRTQQEFANQKLKSEGIVFLNDVLESIGMSRVPEGQIVGWVWDPNREVDGHIGDNYIDFGLYEAMYMDQAKRDFINAAEPCVWIDFNVDGEVYQLI